MTTAPRLPAPWRLVALDCVDSTNDEAKRRADGGAPDRTVVWARRQTAGRGRRGRSWISEPGNLFCSFILRPACPVAEGGQISFVAALAVADALADVAPALDITCKWPNDILIGGEKVAGLLLESQIAGDGFAWLILGAGVNLAHHPGGTNYPATSLTAAGCAEVTAERLLETVCRFFEHWQQRWQVEGFAPVRDAWLARAHGLGGPITARLTKETLTGRFDGIDHSGALVLESEGKTRHIQAADVFYPGTDPAPRRP